MSPSADMSLGMPTSARSRHLYLHDFQIVVTKLSTSRPAAVTRIRHGHRALRLPEGPIDRRGLGVPAELAAHFSSQLGPDGLQFRQFILYKSRVEEGDIAQQGKLVAANVGR